MGNRRSRFAGVCITAAVLFCTSLPAGAVEKKGPQVKVASVNGSVITQGEFDREMEFLGQQLAGMGRTPEDTQLQGFKKDVLERLINRELLYQESKKKGIKIEKQVIDKHMKAMKDKFSSEDEFKKALNARNLSEAQFRNDIGRGLAVQEFVTKEFVEKATISLKESKEYYENHPESFKKPEQVRASHILIKVDPQAGQSQKEASLKKIKEIQKRLKKGEDFATLAKETSQCPSKDDGGDLGFFGRGQTVKPFEDKAYSMKPGELSDVVETTHGYHLIKVTEKKPEGKMPYEEVKERLDQYLKEAKVQEQVGQFVEALKEKAKVERLISGN